MNSTHSTRRGILCLVLVRCGLAFRFPPLGWLLPSSDWPGFFGMYNHAQQWGHPWPSLYHLRAYVTDWVKTLFLCWFGHRGRNGMKNGNSMPAWQSHRHTTFTPTSFFMGETLQPCGMEPPNLNADQSIRSTFNFGWLFPVALVLWMAGYTTLRENM